MPGPLKGVRIIEMSGIGPGPFAGMMLADHGADVVRVDRPGGPRGGTGSKPATDVLARSRRLIEVDLKNPAGVEVVQQLAMRADGLIEGYRPGVMERLGLGPDALLAKNPRLVYGRMTGWGQTGPYAKSAGHDINYVALAGALHAYGRAGEKPTPPINMVADFGGGGMMLAFGMVSAILHARESGRGQVVDAAMTDGAAVLMSMIWGLRAEGHWRDERGVNMLDTGAHFYDTYRTADDQFVSIGSIEPQFYALLRQAAGVADDPAFDAQMDAAAWPALSRKLADIFATRTRAEWCAIMEHTDICFAPVLSMEEAPKHPHNVARQTFVEVDGVVQAAPAPRYSHTVAEAPRMATGRTDTDAILAEFGYDANGIRALRAAKAVS